MEKILITFQPLIRTTVKSHRAYLKTFDNLCHNYLLSFKFAINDFSFLEILAFAIMINISISNAVS